jgi:hypothetical protein
MSSHVKILAAALALPLAVGLNWPGVSCGKNRSTDAKQDESSGRGRTAESITAGVWNGEHVLLEVKQNGATLEFDCAHGSINKPVALDKDGRFSVQGTFAFESGGPATPGSAGGDRPARYAGRVERKKMTLTVTLTDNNQTIDTFTLTHDGTYQVEKCL